LASRANSTVEQIIREAVDDVMASAREVIARAVAELVQAEVERSLAGREGRGGRARRGAGAGAARRRASRPREEITTWVADRRARRVPKFVIAATGLDTKKKIVARFGDGATFEQGKPLPRELGEAEGGKAAAHAAREVKARPPIVRKAAAR
jgi:hypothetical protein